MCGLFEFVKSHMFCITLLATALQVSGTLVLALFSFYGLSITENKDAYFEGVPKVEIKNCWLRASQVALILLLLGILLSGLASLSNAS
ncbi:hypothetical protein A7981_05055 [Methylovorus sp. MM2]|uniref:hypothetical protein n=1 Tax=Methylovorus sp. MM2 TaxID=1848038 RepID=UPI0007E265E1|nr:hypothetical protein [Methylovorus sp. MM2]OAM52811.1 hypothetical protein A7981_05055 [Methylovorus sp. MM2]